LPVRPKLRQSAGSFGDLKAPCEPEAGAANIGALARDMSKVRAMPARDAARYHVKLGRHCTLDRT
jgi:hypothetical protein